MSLFSLKLKGDFIRETCKFLAGLLMLEPNIKESAILKLFEKEIKAACATWRQIAQHDVLAHTLPWKREQEKNERGGGDGGVGHWQYPSDTTGTTIKSAAGNLIEACAASGACV